MENNLLSIALIIIALPLTGAIIAGLFGKLIGRSATHTVTISLVGISFLLACYLFKLIVLDGQPAVDGIVYQWIQSGSFSLNIGLLVDRLSATLVFVVTFVSLMVHIYTIGYMADDPGYQRFFSYVSLFTFAMLTLVLANNFLLLFFGWEGVGLVSYLLIGFWFKREAAVFGSLKAFLVNRIGDIGFVLAIAAILMLFGQLDYAHVFNNVNSILDKTIHVFPGVTPPAITVICVLLFIGAMAKSAQVPLHVWLPESMEGPTPISALIHAATMVTAGIYMVARMSPLFEYSEVTLSLVIAIGATTCFFMGLLAVFHHDIKRVIAYSTLSQLGYMTVALGASAYDAAIFHLLTHAFFKALLFLAAGSVIIALHHEQDMRKMGGLASYMPITYLTFGIGALALAAIPPFAGFYSKDAIIEAVKLSSIPGAGYAYFCVVAGAFITPLYIFRAFFLTFHGEEHLDPEAKKHLQESPWVVLIPLIALAVPSIIAGGILIGPMLFSDPKLLGDSIFVLPQHDVLTKLAVDYQGATAMAVHASHTWTFWLAISGIVAAWMFNMRFTDFAEKLKQRFSWVYKIMVSKYGFDDFNQIVFVRGTRRIGSFFYKVSDLMMIDGIFVNGSGRLIVWFSQVSKRVQSGYLYQYALVMIAGLLFFLGWLLLGF
ncbi:MAG: NADH-quinone oxidoreductase subunit L [Gammaproteobacteria bacterium]|nr:NADH-quinone oxidoreductase subunit L [Gammaproteobacteria bacterium]